MTKQLVTAKDAEYYMRLPYPVQLVRQDEDGDVFWLAEIPDLPGVHDGRRNPGRGVGEHRGR